jgi:hypothetical protein
MLTGREPAAADEVALGASAAAQLGARPGVDTAAAVARLGHLHSPPSATTLAVITLVAAVPLGIAVGRTAWRLFTEQRGVVPDVSTRGAITKSVAWPAGA